MKFSHWQEVESKIFLSGFFESRTPTRPVLTVTSTQLELALLRVLFRHKALLKLGSVIMFIIVSIFSVYLGGNSGYGINRLLHAIR